MNGNRLMDYKRPKIQRLEIQWKNILDVLDNRIVDQ